jgi:hypothetical protein
MRRKLIAALFVLLPSVAFADCPIGSYPWTRYVYTFRAEILRREKMRDAKALGLTVPFRCSVLE